ncbi:MAG: IPT/TIG domain-containing protein [Terriglobia bacterium]|jgi:sugar lactone lactonase YvrE
MSLWKKAEKPESSAEKSEGKEAGKPALPVDKAAVTGKNRLQITGISPLAAIPGGEIMIRGSGLAENGRRPQVRFGDQPGSVLLSSSNRLIVRVPEDVVSRNLTVETGAGLSAPASVVVGVTIAANLHPVANPAVDSVGNIFTTFSGTRGQKVSTSVFKIDLNRVMHPFLNEVMNATGLAFDREGTLYVSSRLEGSIYRVTPAGQRSAYAQGMGVATGIAFDREENLYVGDRTGTIFKISPDRQIFVFATIEPSVAAYHLAFSATGDLYVAGPTTSSFDHVLRISPAGEVTSFYRGLGRPQGMAFDVESNLYVTASLAGRRGVVRLTPDAKAELVVSGYDLVGLAFGRHGSMILATNSSLVDLPLGVEGMPLVK